MKPFPRLLRAVASVLAAVLVAAALAGLPGRAPAATALGPHGFADVVVQALPPEARHTLALIGNGGPYPFERDGAVFGNRERLLPVHERGYYREYTVPTPGLRHRGAKRIIAGRGGELYYTEDHYRSFRRIHQ